MTSSVVETPAYRHTIDRLEAWDKFLPVIEKARESLAANGVESSHHIAQASKMMGLGKGGQREVGDYFLTRLACYLIAMNDTTRIANLRARDMMGGPARCASCRSAIIASVVRGWLARAPGRDL